MSNIMRIDGEVIYCLLPALTLPFMSLLLLVVVQMFIMLLEMLLLTSFLRFFTCSYRPLAIVSTLSFFMITGVASINGLELLYYMAANPLNMSLICCSVKSCSNVL